MKTRWVARASGRYLLMMCLTVGSVSVAGESERVIDTSAMQRGFVTLENMCFSCHSANPGEGQAIAPPMAAIKTHYLNPDSGFDAFRDSLIRFVSSPTAENARMPGAVARFGVMPKMSFDDAVIADVAYYLYHTALESESWYQKRFAGEQARYAARGRPQLSSEVDYRLRGQQIAMQTKTELGSNLKRAIQTGGPESAVSFCKTRANPIALEMSAKLGAGIKRVSDRPRNSANTANAQERAVIEALKGALASGVKPQPVVQEQSGHVTAYYPIVTNAMCLQCHGTVGRDITPATHRVIQDAYPDDEAVGYGENELRGLFVVDMDKFSAEN